MKIKLIISKKIGLDSLKEDYKEFIIKNKQRFRSEKHNVSTEEINMIALRSNDDKIIQLLI